MTERPEGTEFRVSIMQPAYLPWLGYFRRILDSDLHIVLDHVQIDASSKTKFANRNQIRGKQGPIWLTIPLKKAARDEMLLNRIKVADDQNWRRKHLESIRMSFSNAKFFDYYFPIFQEFFSQSYPSLEAWALGSTRIILNELNISTPLRKSSEMSIESKKDDLILEICCKAEAQTYVSGPFGRDYLNAEDFHNLNMKVVIHEIEHPEYPQAFPGFESNMSAIDLLFNCGPEESKRIIREMNSKLVPL